MTMDMLLVLFCIFAFGGAILILWLLFPRGPTLEEIVAQRGPLARIQVFPELRLPDALTEKPGAGWFWAEVAVKILCALAFIWAASGPLDVHVKHDD